MMLHMSSSRTGNQFKLFRERNLIEKFKSLLAFWEVILLANSTSAGEVDNNTRKKKKHFRIPALQVTFVVALGKR